MRLRPKLFLTASIAIFALIALSVWSLLAINQQVVSREIATYHVSALRLEMWLRESMNALMRLEGRAVVFRDWRYAELWNERASKVGADLELLRSFLATDEQKDWHEESARAFETYRRYVAEERRLLARGNWREALRLAEAEARVAAERAAGALEKLIDATYLAIDQSRTEVSRLEGQTMQAVGLVMVVALVLAVATVILLALRMTQSLSRLSTAMAQVAEGAFHAPLRARGRDEIGDLTRSFNRMVALLREGEQVKEEFFSRVSHELRTPLTSVGEATNLLLDRVPGPLEPKQVRLVEIIRLSSERLLRLVNHILEISRLRAGVLPLERRPVDIDKLVARAVDELRPQAEEQAVAVSRVTSGVNFTVTGDEDRLMCVVVNLLGNAVKFTPPGGTVTIQLRDLEDGVAIAVEDTGVGIPASVLPRIFDPYRQAHGARAGSGLGLAIVKGLVEAHRGSVEVHSEEGRGSCFAVRLPRATPGD